MIISMWFELPGWDLHQRVYRVVGLNVDVCNDIDRLLDEEPPTVGDVESVVYGFAVSSEEYYDARLPRHFGFGYSEFPGMYMYVARTRGWGCCSMSSYAHSSRCFRGFVCKRL